jgi:mannosyltransferase
VVHTDAEITPPLYFLTAKLTTSIHFSPEMLRLPSLIAGVLSIPLTYLVGARTIGRRAALVAAALVALSPFLIYYSTEARGYQLAIALLLGSTVSLLRGTEGGGVGWWVLYAACSCTAMLTHYTAAFVLAAQALWALWAHPAARRAVVLANLGAAIAYLPWITGMVADFNSPTTDILSALSPFTPHDIWVSLQHWSVGYPYGFVPLQSLPGKLALVLLGLGLAAGLIGVAWARSERAGTPALGAGAVLVAALALGPLLGEALASLLSTNIFGTRNLAVAWPGFALVLGGLLSAPSRRAVWIAATALVLCGYAIGALKMLDDDLQRPDFSAAAHLIDEQAAPSDVVIDAMVISPGPLSPLDIELDRDHRVIRVDAPQERDHPFNPYDVVVPLGKVIEQATSSLRRGGRLFVVTSGGGPPNCGPREGEFVRRLPPRFRRVGERVFPGICPVATLVYRDSGPPAAKSP